jgi:WD40 repeat protein
VEANKATAANAGPCDDGIPLTWEPGDVILDLYEVRPLRDGVPFAEGGMGRVNRVWHRQWQTHLAVKSVHPGRLKSPQAVEDFQREAKEWVNRIGLHPHVVSCFYVRILSGLPRVFVEFVDGGSLADWINTGQLYEGGPDQALPRLLDTAIQFAWGLHYVHELGLIHQDVKPLNVMMTADGVAKVTDFGLANARAAAFGEEGEPPAGQTLLATWGGMTPAYCSPEQAAGHAQRRAGTPLDRLPKLTRRTDVWSWAVSVLEMFLGRITWPSGSVAHIGLKREAEDPRIPKMPVAVRELLRRCLQQRPDDRPHDLKEAADALHAIYRQVTGESYPREPPRAAEAVADTLNNRAVSLRDLGQREEAERLWEQALRFDPHHLETTYNLGLVCWRSGRKEVAELVRHLEAFRNSPANSTQARLCLGHVHLENRAMAAAIRECEGADSEEMGKLLAWARQALARNYSIKGHTSGVYAVCLSRDGRLALSGGGDGSAKLWETASPGRCLCILPHRTDKVYAVSLSEDGRLALSGSDDGTVILWETAGGRCLNTLQEHQAGVGAVALSGNGRLALSGSSDSTLKLWQTSSGRCLHTLPGHTSGVSGVSLSSDGRLALSGSWDGTVKLWETSSGRCLHTLRGHTDSVHAVSLSGDGRLALSGSGDTTVKLWEVSSGRCLRTLEGHTRSVRAVSLSEDGRLAVSGGDDGTVRLWETTSGGRRHRHEGHTNPVYAVSLSGDGLLALSGSADQTVQLWETSWPYPAPFVLSRLHSAKETVQARLAYDRSLGEARRAMERGEAIQAARHLQRAREEPGYHRSPEALALGRRLCAQFPLRNLRAAILLHDLQGHEERVTAASLTRDGRLALSGSHDGTVRLWDTSTGRCLNTLQGHKKRVDAVRLSGDGRWALATSSWGEVASVKLWETSSGRLLHTQDSGERCPRVRLSGDGRLALFEGDDGSFQLREISSGRRLRTLRGRPSPFLGRPPAVLDVALNGDGRLALSSGGDGTVWLWKTSSGRCLHPQDLGERCLRVSLSGDGRLALLGGERGTITLWKTSSGRRHTLHHRAEWRDVHAVELSGDGRLALAVFQHSGYYEGAAALWETSGGRCLHTFQKQIAVQAVSDDGCLALSSDGPTVKLWYLDWELDDGVSPWWKRWLGLRK